MTYQDSVNQWEIVRPIIPSFQQAVFYAGLLSLGTKLTDDGSLTSVFYSEQIGTIRSRPFGRLSVGGYETRQLRIVANPVCRRGRQRRLHSIQCRRPLVDVDLENMFWNTNLSISQLIVFHNFTKGYGSVSNVIQRRLLLPPFCRNLDTAAVELEYTCCRVLIFCGLCDACSAPAA